MRYAVMFASAVAFIAGLIVSFVTYLGSADDNDKAIGYNEIKKLRSDRNEIYGWMILMMVVSSFFFGFAMK